MAGEPGERRGAHGSAGEESGSGALGRGHSPGAARSDGSQARGCWGHLASLPSPELGQQVVPAQAVGCTLSCAGCWWGGYVVLRAGVGCAGCIAPQVVLRDWVVPQVMQHVAWVEIALHPEAAQHAAVWGGVTWYREPCRALQGLGGLHCCRGVLGVGVAVTLLGSTQGMVVGSKGPGLAAAQAEDGAGWSDVQG